MAKRFKLKPSLDKQSGKYVLNIPAQISKTGKRQRLFYNTQAEALLASKRLKRRHAQFGFSLANLTPARLAECSECYKLIDEFNKSSIGRLTLHSVVTDYLHQRTEALKSIPFGELIDEYVSAREHRSYHYLRHFRYLRNKFESMLNTKVSELSHTKVFSIMQSLPDHRFNSFLRMLTSLMLFAEKKGYVSRNPLMPIEFRHIPIKESEILTPSESSKLLTYAQANFPEFAAYLAIGLFTGIRPEEITQLEPRDVLLDDKCIIVREEVSKIGKKRFVEPLPENVTQWLEWADSKDLLGRKHLIKMSAGAIVYARRKCFEATIGVSKASTKSLFRHCFASFWLAKYGDMHKLALLLGHSSTVISLRRYHRATTREAAEEFFSITP
jgi:integrase